MTTMNIAGKYLSLAQGVAEAALLAPLRSKYKMQFHLPQLAEAAKQELTERGMPITPTNLINAADTVASQQYTMLDDVVGLEQQRWNPVSKEMEEYIVPDTRKYFIR